MVRFSPSAALGEGPYGEGGPEEAQGGPGRAQDRGQRGGAQGEGAKGDPEGEPKEEIPERAQGGVEPRAQWAQCYLRLPDNCCGHCFFCCCLVFFGRCHGIFLAAVIGCCGPWAQGPRAQGTGAQEPKNGPRDAKGRPKEGTEPRRAQGEPRSCSCLAD